MTDIDRAFFKQVLGDLTNLKDDMSSEGRAYAANRLYLVIKRLQSYVDRETTMTPQMMLRVMDAIDGVKREAEDEWEELQRAAEDIYNSGPHADIPHPTFKFEDAPNYIQEYCLGMAYKMQQESWNPPVRDILANWTSLDERTRLEAAGEYPQSKGRKEQAKDAPSLGERVRWSDHLP